MSARGADLPVLIADDDPDLRALFGIALRRAGITTIDVPDGESALRTIETRPVALVVCDLSMPGISGVEVVRALRARPDTSTLPFLLTTGSGDGDTVIEALAAGADDFLTKPVRIDELIARVRAHLRTTTAWSEVIEAEFRDRADAVQAIARLALPQDLEEAAGTIVSEIGRRTGPASVGLFHLAAGPNLTTLATYDPGDGLCTGGPRLDGARAGYVRSRATSGAWSEVIGTPAEEGIPRFWSDDVEVAAAAPIHAGDVLVGVLVVASARGEAPSPLPTVQSRLMARVIDYAAVVSVVVGQAMSDGHHIDREQTRLRAVLSAGAFHPVFQPIVALEDRSIVGYEALTRFHDGVRPDLRFAEAAAAGLGDDYELATLGAALEGGRRLPPDAYLALNISPDLVLGATSRLRPLLERAGRRVVLEVTEHARIVDYAAFGRCVRQLGDIRIAVDDAGAGFASLRHILELEPAFAKLDITLVSGIHADPIRQALAAGLAYFAGQTGCQLIAEGVESQADADVLLEVGIRLAQGHLFGRPQPMEP